jgi:predicted peptidase
MHVTKPLLLTLALATVVPSTAPAASAQAPTPMQTAHTFKTRLSRTVSLNYLLFLPQDYSRRRTQRWPLILFLHGAGERGTDLAKVKIHGPPKLVANRPDFPFILVSPQCPEHEIWDPDSLVALLDHVLGRYRVDPSRVYLTGLSMGGYGTWALGVRYPERFAAIAPICGGGDVLPVHLGPNERNPALRTLAVWAFHGAKDPVVPLSESERMVEALRKAGCAEVNLTVYPEAGHDAWTETYANPQLYDWFLKHQRTELLPTSSKPRASRTSRSSRPGR